MWSERKYETRSSLIKRSKQHARERGERSVAEQVGASAAQKRREEEEGGGWTNNCHSLPVATTATTDVAVALSLVALALSARLGVVGSLPLVSK